MLKRIKLERFKNFQDAELRLEPFTLLIGTNASGKSNIYDAIRFLHGVGRGYSLAEIFDAQRNDAGEVEWRGIRGGRRNITFLPTLDQNPTFALEAEFSVGRRASATYRIEVEAGRNGQPPHIRSEKLASSTDSFYEIRQASHPDSIEVEVAPGGKYRKSHVIRNLSSERPVLPRLLEEDTVKDRSDETIRNVSSVTKDILAQLRAIRFLDVNPDAMRQYSTPGQRSLSDRGDNFSSVLQTICVDADSKRALVGWIRELTPMDVTDFHFLEDASGRVLASFVEENGQETFATNASDGTLRFLATLVALLGFDTPQLYFLEELENGLHPARLHLLIQFIEQRVAEGKIRVIATTHSSQALRFLRDDPLNRVAEVYRLAGSSDAHIRRLSDIPEAKRVVEQTDTDLGTLLESGWFEVAVDFLHDETSDK